MRPGQKNHLAQKGGQDIKDEAHLWTNMRGGGLVNVPQDIEVVRQTNT